MAKSAKPVSKKVSKRKTKLKKEHKTLADDSSESISETQVRYEGPVEGDTLGKNYKILRRLGEGGFGAVFEVVDTKTNERYAVKVELEKPPPDEPGLLLEGQVLKKLQGSEHILRYIDEGQWGENKISYLIMQLAGHSLESHRKKRPTSSLSVSTQTRLALQCIDGITTLHDAGLLHRDIKPGNYAMGLKGNDVKIVYVLDFGLVRRFLKDGKVRHQRRSAGFRGSVQYASLNAHRNIDLGRVDDFWCWLYSMIHLRTGKLPWRNISGMRKVGMMKMKVSKNELLEGMEVEYHKIYDSLTVLKYADKPPVPMYRSQITVILKRLNITNDEPFDWEIPDKAKVQAEAKIPSKPAVPQAKKVESPYFMQFFANFFGGGQAEPKKVEIQPPAKEGVQPPAKEAVKSPAKEGAQLPAKEVQSPSKDAVQSPTKESASKRELGSAKSTPIVTPNSSPISKIPPETDAKQLAKIPSKISVEKETKQPAEKK